MNEQENDIDNIKQEYIKQLEADYRYSISKFDDQALYISSGALAISLTFVKDIVPIKDSKFIIIYFLALLFFALTILISFISHYRSSRLIDNRIKDVEENKFDVQEDNSILLLNRITTALLTIGVFCLVIFSVINIYIYRSNPSEEYFKFTKQSKDGSELNIEGKAWELVIEDTTLNIIKLKKK